MNNAFSRYLNTPVLYLFALALGLCQALVFDFSFDSELLCIAPVLSLFSLSGFLWILKELSPKKSMLFGYFFGLGVFSWGLNWIYISMDRFGGASIFFAILANAAIIAYLSLYWLVISYVITRLGKTSNQRLILAAPVIALFEWIRSVFLLGFPWLSIGYGWVDTPMALLSSLGGVWLVSFVVVLIAGVIALPAKKHSKYFILFGALCLFYLLPRVIATPDSERTIKVALVQGNMPVITEYNNERMQQNIVSYSQLTKAIIDSGEKPDLIIWPESSIPYFNHEIDELKTDILQWQNQYAFDFISGVAYFDMPNEKFYNAILLQKNFSSIDETQYYFKHHLLPFGEYLPFRGVLDFFENFVTIPMAEFTRGQLMQPSFVSAGVRLSPSICFEAVFGNEIRKKAANSDVLLNISNDAWFGQSKAQSQHFNIARMRAIENQKYLVRATNNGLTAIVAPTGVVKSALLPFGPGFIVDRIAANSEQTFYARYGDAPWLVIFVFLLGYFRKNRNY